MPVSFSQVKSRGTLISPEWQRIMAVLFFPAGRAIIEGGDAKSRSPALKSVLFLLS
jgi:hypothetical protein